MVELKAPLQDISATLTLSGSKSISSRLLILGRVLERELALSNVSDSTDTLLLTKALELIGSKKTGTIDVQHAGTTMRFLTALLSVTEGEWVLTGSDRMKERPIGELVQALQTLGADINYLEKTNYPPIAIKGRSLSGGTVTVRADVSSQFLSALLLVSPAFKNGLTLILEGEVVSRPYLDMTLALLKQNGCDIREIEKKIEVRTSAGNKLFSKFEIESDWSSASYLYSICALAAEAEISLRHFSRSSLQADSIVPVLFEKLGVKTEFSGSTVKLKKQKVVLRDFDYNFSACPDLAPTLAATCFGLGLRARLSGLKTLVIKESNRIEALKQELGKFGARVETGPDHIDLYPEGKHITAASTPIQSHNDHRITMSLAPLALKCGKLYFDNANVVDKSYPAFWRDLISLGFSVNLQP